MPLPPKNPLAIACGLLALLPLPMAIVLPMILCRSAEQQIEAIKISDSAPTEPKPNPAIPTRGPEVAYNTIRLQRIEPQPIPVAPVPTPTQPPPPPPYRFEGQLIGTILDTDPAFSFALIELPDKRIRLVRQSMAVDEINPHIIVHQISTDKVMLLLGDTIQELELNPRSTPTIQ